MPTERVLENIPESDVNRVIKDFESEGCRAVSERQANGIYTVRATCPDRQPDAEDGGS